MPYNGLKTGRSLEFSGKEVNKIQETMTEPKDESGVIEKNFVISFNDEYGNFQLKGVEPQYQEIFKLEFEPGNGRFINKMDMDAINKVIVLDKKIVDVLFKKEKPLG